MENNDKINKSSTNVKWMWVIGFIFIFVLVYSNMVIDEYKISFTNLMYSVTPWSSEGISNEGPYLSDVSDSSYPEIYSKILSEDSFSFWNIYNAVGYDLNMREMLYPMNIVFALPLDIAIFLKYFIEFMCAFIGMYLLLKVYKISKVPSAIGGILYAFSSVIVVWLGWPHSDVAALAPLAFYMTEKIINHIELKFALGLAAVIYTMIMAGMPTYAAYFMYLLGIYAIVVTIWKYKKEKIKILKIAGLFTLGNIIGILLSFPYIVSLLDTVGSNGYSDSRISQGNAILDIGYIRTVIYPYLREGLNSHINESTIYTGLFSVVLLPFSIVRGKNKKHMLFYFVTAVITTLLIFTHCLDFVYKLLPAINTSLKFRVITLLNFALIIMTILNFNDIYENKQWYKKNWYIIPIAGLLLLVVLSISTASFKGGFLDTNNTKTYICVILLSVLMYIMLIGYIFMNKEKIIVTILFILVAFDMGRFANKYLPWIEKEAEIIPEATDSIEYMQENTAIGNRVTGLGMWTLYPNTNIYYGLSDLRGHSFIFTNADVKEYYTQIDNTCYTTPTRVAFNKINNYNLIKYLGVKYLFAESLLYEVEYGNIESEKTEIGILEENDVIEQEFVATEDNLKGVSILFATYGEKPTDNSEIKLEIWEAESGTKVGEKKIRICELQDNAYERVLFNKIENSIGRKYIIKLIVPHEIKDNITIWKTTEETENTLCINGRKTVGNIIMSISYDKNNEYKIVYNGKDGLQIGEMKEYSDKVELAVDEYYCTDYETVLEQMKGEYRNTNVFIVGAGENNSTPIESNEYAKLISYKGDTIEIKYTSNYDRYIVINDYYDSNWRAYINGEEIEIEKVNYLLRGVKVTKGEDITLVLRYVKDCTVYYIAGGVGLIYVSIIIIYIIKGKKKKHKEYTYNDHTFAICAYKDSPYLEKCIKSIINQTIKSNIILATSTPSEYIDKLAEKYGIPVFVRNGKSNIALDWNFAYDCCNTELVTIAHQDDIYKEDYLKEALQKLNKAKNPIIYFNNYNEIKNGEEVSKNRLLSVKRLMLIPLIPKVFQGSKFVRRRVLSMGCPILCPSVIYLKSRMPHPLYESKMRASLDWEEWEILSRLEGEFVYSKKVLTCHRIHPDSETSAAINDCDRIKEDYEMFCKFWPAFIAKILRKYYSKSQDSNNEIL